MKNIPKIELHCHLDGSIRPETLANLSGFSLEEVKAKTIASIDIKDLNEYLEKFDLPISLLQTKDTLLRVTKELVEDLVNDGVIYAEIRFAPLKHTKAGLTGEEVVESVLAGLKEAPIPIRLILCMMRDAGIDENREVINLAVKFQSKGVCAIDLAGAEALYKTKTFKPLFIEIKKNNIPITIHAGEADGISSILSAISFGAKRIGHGIRAIEDQAVCNLLKSKRILLEICPTSNIQTKVVDKYENHPIKELFNMGCLVSINTDNRTVSNTTLTCEYELLKDKCGFSINDFYKMNLFALESAFITDKEKDLIRLKLMQR